MIWDSRLIHDNRPPINDYSTQGQQPNAENAPRWRLASFVSMTPAAWATQRDLDKKQQAYENLLLTNHWSSQKFKVLEDKTPRNQFEQCVKNLPEIALSLEAKRLAGVEAYDFNDDLPNGPAKPEWLEN